MKKIIFALLTLLFTVSSNATVILEDFVITDSNLSFQVTGSVSTLGSGYNHQLLFGLVDDSTSDWINSFDASSSSWIDGVTNSVTTNSVYDLSGSYSDSLLTVGSSDWQIGDIIDITFNFVGDFDLSNFDINNFGMQAGYTTGSIVDSTYNLVGSVNPRVSIPEPISLSLLVVGLVGIRLSRKSKAA